MAKRLRKRHRWFGPTLDRSGHEQTCEDCGAVKGFFASQAAKIHGVDTLGCSTTLYRDGEKWTNTRPLCH